MANTYISSQTTLGLKKSGDASYTTIANVISFGGPTFQVASIETTNLSDTAKKYRPGIVDSGEMKFEVNFDPADTGHIGLKTLIESPAVASWQITFPTSPNATMFTFDGFPTGMEVGGGGPEEKVTASLTIKITGTVTVTTAS
jgi:hypothetical protein